VRQHDVRLIAQGSDDVLEQGGGLPCLRKMNRQNLLYHPHFARRVDRQITCSRRQAQGEPGEQTTDF
jgi:hypothetical protein